MAVHIQLLDKFVAFLYTRAGKVAIGILILALLVIITLPYAISYSVRDWLNNNGADQVEIEDVDFNLFSGRLEFINLRITVAGDYTLLLKSAWVNADWLPLLNKTFHIKEVFVENTDIAIEEAGDGKVVVGGIAPKQAATVDKPATEAKPAKPWGFGIAKLTILGSRFRYARPDLSLELFIDKAGLTGLDSAKTEPAMFTLQGRLNGAPLSINASLRPFASKPAVKAAISLQDMPLTSFRQLAAEQAEIAAGQLDLDIDVDASYDSNGGVTLAESGKLSVSGLDVRQGDRQFKAGAMAWNGEVNVTPATGDAGNAVKVTGAIEASDLGVANLAADSVLLDLKQLAVDRVEATTSSLHLGELKLATLVANIDRDQQGSIVLPAASPATPDDTLQQAEAAATETTPAETAQPQVQDETSAEATATTFAISVDKITLGNAIVNFTDASTAPAFTSALAIDSFEMTALDNTQPEQAAPFSLQGKIGKFSTVNASGELRPFGEKLNMEMTAKLEAVEMPPLSSYTAGMLGHYLLNGQLNSDIKLSIKDDIIDANSKLLVSNIEVRELTAEEKKNINTTASAPLSLGISMLSDRDDNIKLDIPFKGDINDPNIDVSDAINQVISKAISTASLAYLKLSLQPFGTLLALAEVAGDISKGVSLQPVVFASGSATLDATALQYKDKIATMMTERPGLRLKICGIATSRDRNTLVTRELERLKAEAAKLKKSPAEIAKIPIPTIPDETLLAIARERADNLKALLINEKKIAPSRLFDCLPAIDAEAGTEPRVEVKI